MEAKNDNNEAKCPAAQMCSGKPVDTHGGVGHWKNQRLTAVLSIPLSLWLVWSVVHMQGWSYDVFTAWLAMPVNAVLMSFSVIVMFYHAMLGIEVIVEDYVSDSCSRGMLIAVMKFVMLGGMAVSLFAVWQIVFGG